MNKLLLSATAMVMLAAPAFANDYAEAMESFYEDSIKSWLDNDAIVSGILAQNDTTADFTDAEIDALDQEWRASTSTGSPTIDAVTGGALADILREMMDASEGATTEIFVMDARGLNVAASDITSDYWQGDEEKHSETYGKGTGAVHYSEIEFDESTQSYQAQISVTVVNPADGSPIGAITVGVNADALM